MTEYKIYVTGGREYRCSSDEYSLKEEAKGLRVCQKDNPSNEIFYPFTSVLYYTKTEVVPQVTKKTSLEAFKHRLMYQVCKEVHGGSEPPCTNQTASCMNIKLKVCDFNRIVDQIINEYVVE